MKNYSGREVYASHYLDEGDYGATYIYDDIVIKKYFNNNSVDGHIKPGIFEKIKEIDSPAFIKLLDCTYELFIIMMDMKNLLLKPIRLSLLKE